MKTGNFSLPSKLEVIYIGMMRQADLHIFWHYHINNQINLRPGREKTEDKDLVPLPFRHHKFSQNMKTSTKYLFSVSDPSPGPDTIMTL